jgi:hypothetical protein
MNEGLVAPSWSDSGDVPVGEVTYDYSEPIPAPPPEWCRQIEGWPHGKIIWANDKPSDPNAKPAMSALSKVAGESCRGLGWCDE